MAWWRKVLDGVLVQNDPINLIDPTGLDWQFAFGISGTVGGMIPPFILGPSGFGGGGMVVGFNSSGQLFVQAQANLMAGAGTFAGVGFVGGITHSDCSMESGLNTSESTYGEANAGWGVAGGAYGARGDDGSFGVGGTPLPRLGFGYGAMAAAGRSTTTTYATRPLW